MFQALTSIIFQADMNTEFKMLMIETVPKEMKDGSLCLQQFTDYNTQELLQCTVVIDCVVIY